MSDPRISMVPVVANHALAEDLSRMGEEFFGVSLARHSPATLLARLDELGVRLLVARVGNDIAGIAGYTVNPQNRRQATVSVSAHTADLVTATLTAHLHLLRTVARIGSFISIVSADSPTLAAYRAAGFGEVGRLRARRYHDHRYHNDVVLHSTYVATECSHP